VGSCYFIDLLPLHFHLRRDRLFGEFGSLLQSPLIALDRAQYESPLAVPGRILSPPSAALPACPYFTVFLRPVAGLVTTFLNRFSIIVAFLGLSRRPFERDLFLFYQSQRFALAAFGIDTAPCISASDHQTPRQIERVA